MNTLDAIFSRRSVRKFKDEKLSEEAIHTILKAGMSGPTCVNARDWSFIVVDDLTLLKQMADANGKPAKLLEKAPLAILICGDTGKAFKMAKDYWIIDGAIAGQNMILAAQDLGIGSVWLGTYPQMERVQAQKELFNLPEDQVPHSIIAFGYPQEEKNESRDLYDQTVVHYNKW